MDIQGQRAPVQDPIAWLPPASSSVDFLLNVQPATLSIVSSILLLLATPSLLRFNRDKQDVVAVGSLFGMKSIPCVLLVALELECLIMWVEIATHPWDLTIIAAFLSSISYLCLTFLVLTKHTGNLKSSATIAIWLVFAIACDIIRASWYFKHPQHGQFIMMTICLVISKCGLLILEEMPKHSAIKDEALRKMLTKQQTYGFWTRALINCYAEVTIGFRGTAEVESIDEADEKLSSKLLLANFQAHWNKEDKTSIHRLRDALYQTHRDDILETYFTRLCVIIFNIPQVPFTWYLLAYKEQPNALWNYKGTFIFVATCMCVGITVSKTSYLRALRRLQSKVRSTLLAQVHDKILSSQAPRVSPDAARSFVADTIDKVILDIPKWFDGCASVVEIAIGIYFFYVLVGRSGVLAFVPLTLVNVLAWYSSRYYYEALFRWQSDMTSCKSRASTIFTQIKAIQMIGLEDAVSKVLCQLQEKSLNHFMVYRAWAAIMIVFDGILDTLPAPMIIGGTLFWTSTQPILRSRDVFTIFMNITLLYRPLANAIKMIAYPGSNKVRLHQIQEFYVNDDSIALAVLGFPASAMPQRGIGVRGGAEEESKHDGTESEKSTANTQSATPMQNTIPQQPEESNVVVQFHEASITARASKAVLLKGVNLSIKRAELVMVVGPTGSGKSTLLKAIVGDAAVPKGEFYKEPGVVAYCDQNSWLYHASILENVVGRSQFNMVWYRAVLKACLLSDDLKQLVRSDKSLTGTNGTGLSSGQAHRVALARALYLRAPIIVLDDIFAALDRRTANQIFARLFGDGGLLRDTSTTVIMATRPNHILQAASRVIFIDSHGHISTRQDYRSTDFRQQLRLVGHSDGDADVGTGADVNDQMLSKSRGSSSVLQLAHDRAIAEGRAVGPWQSLGMFLRTFKFRTIFLMLLYVVGASVATGFQTGYMRLWFELDPTNMRYFYGFIGLTLFNAISDILGLRHWSKNLEFPAASTMHRTYVNSILRAKLYFVTGTNQDEIISHFNTLIQLIPKEVIRNSIVMTNYCLVSLIRIGTIASASVYCASLLVPIFFSIYFGCRCFSQMSDQVDRCKSKIDCRLIGHLVKTATGQRHIYNLGWKDRVTEEGHAILDAYQKPYTAQLVADYWVLVFSVLVANFCVLMLVVIAVVTSCTAAAIGSAIVLASGYNFTFALPIKCVVDTRTAGKKLARLYEFFESIPVERQGPSRPLPITRQWPVNGRILMNNVTAKYRSKDKQVLKDVSFMIAPGQKVGIVGRTGSGKSSVLMALLNFLEYQGTIKIDGIDIKTVSIGRLRASITTISHEQIQLSGSVRHSLYPWPTSTPIDDEKFEDVLTGLGLWDIIKQQGGLDAIVSDLGLSYGQQQLLSIGRGMIHKLENNTKIVIMDESTSSLDLGTEKVVHDAINQIFRNCTILIIAHRKEILEDADTILHMSEGDMFARTYPKAEKAAAAKAKAKAEKEAKLKEERDNVENAVEVEGGREFDGDDELDEDDDEVDGASDDGEATGDAQNTTVSLQPTGTEKEDRWVGVETGSVPSVAPGLQQIVAEMENTRPPPHEGSSEEKLDGVIEYFNDRRTHYEQRTKSSAQKMKEDGNHTV